MGNLNVEAGNFKVFFYKGMNVIVWIGHVCLGVGNSEETARWAAP